MSKEKMPEPFTREFFAAHGRTGGKLGGKAAAANMTKKERKVRALKAVAAREAKRKGKDAVLMVEQVRRVAVSREAKRIERGKK